ncbi:hypothetical protein ACIQUY_34745 [Streptomyces sp. NPDC090231]|uniref:hypothetical protein n=1 Tax=unclassified Streptomyces TaxID=2593676 RepID=UPI002E101373
MRCRRCSYRPLTECTHLAWLYDVALAKPKRTATLAQEWALDRAMAARQTCPVPACRPRQLPGMPRRNPGRSPHLLRTHGTGHPPARRLTTPSEGELL